MNPADLSVALISSNQPDNRYKDDPRVSEQDVMQKVSYFTMGALLRCGVRCANFFFAKQGDSGLDELDKAIDAANAWGPDLVLSLHSDAIGSDATDGVLPIVVSDARVPLGTTLGKYVAGYIPGGWPLKTTRIKGFNVLTKTNAPAVLLELGEHATVREAAFIRANIMPIGEAVAHAVCDYYKVPWVPREADPVEPPAPQPEPPSLDLTTLKLGLSALTERVEGLEERETARDAVALRVASRLSALETFVTNLRAMFQKV